MAGWMHRAVDEKVEIERVAYHRNGIAGNGFHVILFRQLDNTPMMGVLFEEAGNIAVFNRELAGQGNVDFYANSWRGDEFEQALRTAVAEYRRAVLENALLRVEDYRRRVTAAMLEQPKWNQDALAEYVRNEALRLEDWFLDHGISLEGFPRAS